MGNGVRQVEKKKVKAEFYLSLIPMARSARIDPVTGPNLNPVPRIKQDQNQSAYLKFEKKALFQKVHPFVLLNVEKYV